MTDSGRCPECGEYRYWCRNLGCTTGPVEEPHAHDCGGHPDCDWCRGVVMVGPDGWGFSFSVVTVRRRRR